MSIAFRQLRLLNQQLGLDVRHMTGVLRNIPWFLRSWRQYEALDTTGRFAIQAKDLYPQLCDRNSQAGYIDPHYFYQDVWAARKIYAARPASHLDIGSRLDGFISHLLVFTSVTVVDIRPLTTAIDGLSFIRDDATELERFADNSVVSLSSLHAIEHFGLGRYGDPIHPQAWEKALRSLVRVLAPGGKLYLSVPVGRERVEFNAHRVFLPQTIMATLGDLQMLSFAAVDDCGVFHAAADPKEYDHCHYSCGMFEFAKVGVEYAERVQPETAV